MLDARLAVLPLAFVSCFAGLASAQDFAAPSDKLAVFRPMVGMWKGEGTAAQSADMDAMPWTATVHFQPILDGHFFQEDIVIAVGAPTPIVMRSIYGWDAENERYVMFGLGNTGESEFHTLRFPTPGTMVVGHAGVRQGEFATSRSVTRITADAITFEGERANGAGPWFTEVTGKLTKTDAKPPELPAVGFVGVPVASQTKALADRMAGTYAITGSMSPAPGAPDVEISGIEKIAPAFGGHAVHSIVEGTAGGEGPKYVAHNFMVWNANDQCFESVAFDNLGTVGRSQAWMAGDDTLVTVFAGKRMGQPIAERGTLKFGDDGPESWTSHTMAGAGEPRQTFHATYARKSD